MGKANFDKISRSIDIKFELDMISKKIHEIYIKMGIVWYESSHHSSKDITTMIILLLLPWFSPTTQEHWNENLKTVLNSTYFARNMYYIFPITTTTQQGTRTDIIRLLCGVQTLKYILTWKLSSCLNIQNIFWCVH